MLKKSKLLISILAVTAALAVGCVSVYAACVPDTNKAAASSETTEHGHMCPMCGRGPSAMRILSVISGKSVEEIMKLYPQKTAWQAAKAMGKLDDLKEEYLAQKRTFFNKLAEDKKISKQDADKMYEDLQKRVKAIDGVNTVITGRPDYRPQRQSESSK